MKVILPLLVFILTFASAVSHYFLFEQWRVEREVLYEQVRMRAVKAQCNALSKRLYDAGVAMGGYSITENDLYWDRFNKIIKGIPEDLKELRALEESDSVALKKVDEIEVTINDGMKLLLEAKESIDYNAHRTCQLYGRHRYKELRAIAQHLHDQLKDLQLETKAASIKDQGRQAITLLMIGFALNCVSLLLPTIHIELLSRSKNS